MLPRRLPGCSSVGERPLAALGHSEHVHGNEPVDKVQDDGGEEDESQIDNGILAPNLGVGHALLLQDLQLGGLGLVLAILGDGGGPGGGPARRHISPRQRSESKLGASHLAGGVPHAHGHICLLVMK